MFSNENPGDSPRPYDPVMPDEVGLDPANQDDLQLYIDGKADKPLLNYLRFRRSYELAADSNVITPTDDQRAELLDQLDERIAERGQEILDWRDQQESPS